MSSPDQLDKMIVITSPSFWLALLGGALIVAVALVWSIFGRLPVKLKSTGIVVQDGGSYIMSTDTGGIVTSVEVEDGDYVEEGDVVLVLSDEAVMREIDGLKERRANVEAVTLDSQGDIVTADNRELINLKNQLTTVGLGTEQQQAMLGVYRDELEELLPELEEAERQKECARADYYSYIQSIKSTGIELDFTEAQSDFNILASQYNSASSNASAAYSTYSVSLSSVVDGLRKKLQTALTDLQEQLAQAETADEISAVTAQINAVEFNLTALSTVKSGTAPEDLSPAVQGLMGDTYSQLENLYLQYETAVDILSTVEEKYHGAVDDYEDARDIYEDYADFSADFNADKERISTIYSEKTNEYNSLYSNKVNLEANIASLEGQLKAAELGADSQKDAYEAQFEATRAALLDSIDSEIEKYEYSQEKTRVKAAMSGTVCDLRVSKGMALGQGGEVATIQQQAEGNMIVCYIPITTGKKVEPGMRVIVCPTTVNQQEYGHMQAEVVEVDGYVATTLDMRTVLGDDLLVQSFTQNGPVIGVTCRMRMDDSTASGYWWSNKKGASLTIPEGTLVSADIVTEEKAPISMLIPMLKEKLSMNSNPGGGMN